MNWLTELLSPGNTSLASTLVLYSFVIAAGVFLGKMKIGGVSLGAIFVLFMGLLVGHLGYTVSGEVLSFVREFGLILFIFSIGLQVGPGFFTSFKHGGVRLNMLAVGAIALSVALVLTMYYLSDEKDIAALVGVMSGAVTNTPGLAAAQQSAGSIEAGNVMAMAYAAAYPLGVVGIIVAMLVIKVLFKIRVSDEADQLQREQEAAQLQPHLVSYEVTNTLVAGKNLAELHRIINCNFVVSRMIDTAGNLLIPDSHSVLEVGDKLYIALSPQDEERFNALVGPQIEMDWETVPGSVVSRRVVITKSEYNGVQLDSLRLHSAYRLNVTRVNRAGIDLLAAANLRLQMGDRLTVVGDLGDITRLGNRLGNSMRRLHQPNIITIFVGIFLGIVLGSANLGYGLKLGLAGGPLIVAILLSRFGYRLKLVTYTSTSASMLMRELGICLFLASVGIASGAGFAATVFNATGMWWVILGFIITFVPLIVMGIVARGVYKINYLTIMGLIAGSYTDPPALAYAASSTGSDAPAVAYSTVYPLTMFLRIVAAQALIMALFSL